MKPTLEEEIADTLRRMKELRDAGDVVTAAYAAGRADALEELRALGFRINAN